MFLKVKDIDIATGGSLISIIHYKDAEKLDLKETDRILLKKGKKEIITSLNISKSSKSIKEGEIGLFEELLDLLKVKKKDKIKVKPTHLPQSIELIKKKLDGKPLSKKEIDIFVKDLIENDLTEIELAYFVAACYNRDLSKKEIIDFTKAIVNKGSKIKFNKKVICDKHCIGGIANNRTTMIVTPILAAAGLTIPKTSSRSITSASGTSDTMEVLSKVNFDAKTIKNIVKKTNACMCWDGGISSNIDSKLIKVRHSLRLDPEGLMLISILAKKARVSSTHVLIDIPIGKTAKVCSLAKAKKLKKKFKELGKALGIKVKVIITDGSQPIGNGVGPNLEARDVLYILKRDPKAPKDLEKKSIMLANKLFKMTKTKANAKEILESGLAYEKMKQIIKAQKGKPSIKPENIKVGKYKFDYKAPKRGIISEIDNKKINKIARLAGAPKDKEAGIYLYKHLNENVKRGEAIFTIYSENKEKLEYARLFLKKQPIEIK